MNDTVIIKVFADPNDSADSIFAAYNFKSMAIPVGKEVEVPRKIYEVLAMGHDKDRVSLVRG